MRPLPRNRGEGKVAAHRNLGRFHQQKTQQRVPLFRDVSQPSSLPARILQRHQEWRRKYFHLALRRGRKIAKVAMARRLAVRLYWMWRKGWDYEQLKNFGSHAGQPGNPDGVQSSTE